MFGARFKPILTLKALTFYEKGDLEKVPAPVRRRLVEAVVRIDLNDCLYLNQTPVCAARAVRLIPPVTSDVSKPSLVEVARNVIWFMPPHEALKNETPFLSHVMIYGNLDDILEVRRHFEDERLRDVLRNAYPGIWDRRSWSYWHTVLELLPVPPLAVRFPELHESLRGYGGPPQRGDLSNSYAKPVLSSCSCRIENSSAGPVATMSLPRHHWR